MAVFAYCLWVVGAGSVYFPMYYAIRFFRRRRRQSRSFLDVIGKGSAAYWRDHLLFYEYFHGDNGAGIGASHQTGWIGQLLLTVLLGNHANVLFFFMASSVSPPQTVHTTWLSEQGVPCVRRTPSSGPEVSQNPFK